MSGNELKRSKLFGVLDVLGNLFVLNLIYILFSLPIVTIGASTTAMYSVTIKMVRKEDGPLWAGFVKEFKGTFARATKLWFIILGVLACVFAQYLIVVNYPGTLADIYLVVIVIELLLIFVGIPFIFPLQARYDNGVISTIKNAFLLSVSGLGACIKINIAWIGPIALSIIYPKLFLFTWYFWLILFFALIAYMASFSANRIFDKVEEAASDKESQS